MAGCTRTDTTPFAGAGHSPAFHLCSDHTDWWQMGERVAREQPVLAAVA
jgi:hypothetical protein